MTDTTIFDPCIYCGRSTAPGSELFMNRIPASTDEAEGWACRECSGYECDECGKQIDLDEEVRAGSDESPHNYHVACYDPDLHGKAEYGQVYLNGGNLFILNAEGQPVRCLNTLKWGRWMAENAKSRLIAQERVGPTATVSTAFVGVNYALDPEQGDPPLLWETIVIDGGEDSPKPKLASTREEALVNHHAMVARMQGDKND